MSHLDQEWIWEASRTSGFSIPTIQILIEIAFLQKSTPSLKSSVLNLMSALKTPQKWFSIRINPIRIQQSTNINLLENIKQHFNVKRTSLIKNMQFLHVEGPFALTPQSRELNVDKFAAESIMTGANLYIPGFLRPLPKFQKGEIFSIHGPNHIHVGNGVTQYSHKQILDMENGIGIQTFESLYKIPPYRDSEYYSKGIISDHSFGPFLACNLLMNFHNDPENQAIIDMCSAPGHKSSAISEIGYEKYGKFPKIFSIDRSRKRLESLHQDINRLGLESIEVIPKKIEKLANSHPELLNSADFLILDPPCSALGTRPKLSIIHTKEDFRSFFLLQRRLIKEINQFLKFNGLLLYTTCTLSPLENEGIVGILIRKYGFELLDAHAILPKLISPKEMDITEKEIHKGIERKEELIKSIPLADKDHIADLDRYLTLSTKDAQKLIRVDPKGEHSTGYFIAILQKKSE